MTVDTEAGAATDDLSTISGGTAGQMIVLKSSANARDTTVRDGTGNIQLDGGVDYTLTGSRDTLTLIRHPTVDNWLEISRSNNN